MNANITAHLAAIAIALACTSISPKDIASIAAKYGVDDATVSSLAHEMKAARKVALSDMKHN